MSKNSILALVCGVGAMTVIDLAVVNVALPSIQSELDASPADLQWVVVAYAVLVAGFLLLGDLLGHRLTLVIGIAVLSAASLVGGFFAGLSALVAVVGLRPTERGAISSAPSPSQNAGQPAIEGANHA